MEPNTHVAVHEALFAALPASLVVTNPVSLEAYRWDRAEDPRAALPIAVVRAETTEQVQLAVRVAAEVGVPVVPRGAGTGLSAGASSDTPALVISLERMRGIEVDAHARVAVVQPGALNVEVKRAAAAHGLWYPPDPSSYEICSIGGNIATNAGGLCCVKYGVTADYVLGLTVVLADGRAVTLGGPRLKDVSGLALTKLFVGSEGTLGIVTEAVLRLIPAHGAKTTLVAVFAELTDAMAAVVDITRSYRPAMMEFLDRAAIAAIEDDRRMGLDREAAAMLIMQIDEGGAAAAAAIESMCEGHGATECYSTDDPDEGEQFVEARRAALPAFEKLGSLLLEDIGVPVSKLGELVLGVEAIAAAHDVITSVAAHAGDGNTHPLIVIDREDPAQQQRAHAAYDDLMALAMRLGGTISGEHGVGRLKAPWLEQSLGSDAYELNLRIKAALDPHGVFNPGAKFDASAVAVSASAQNRRLG